MIRVVLDANVFVSSLLNSKGTPALILNHLKSDHFKLVMSQEILEEIEGVLRYPKLIKLHRLSSRQIKNVLESLRILSVFVLPKPLKKIESKRDPSDDVYLATAVSGGVDFIVSGDKDLLCLNEYEQIPIVSPRQFLTVLESL